MKHPNIIIPKETIRRALGESLERVLGEGIDFDYYTKEVSYNPSHEENVDTSVEDNPTMDGGLINGINVWSIFKRRKRNQGDGNPLIYALKGEEGWHFKSNEDAMAVEKQFDMIATKFAKLYPIGVTVIVPSGSALNKHIAEVVMSKSQNANLIEGAICKLTTEEVYDIVMADDSEFRRFYGPSKFNAAFRRLLVYFEKMNKERDGTFSRHMVRDQQMRNILNRTLKTSKERYAEFANVINGEDILIIDDTISRGQTIKEACDIMMESYNPKSITVLTLLSKLN